MYGYIIPNESKLKREEFEEYRANYCGLCISLKNKFGNLERMTVNYDTTFLILILNGLYEEKEEIKISTCIAHPFKKKKIVLSEVSNYASDMNILLSYYKFLDDVYDENKFRSKIYLKLLKKSFLKVQNRYEEKCERIKEEFKNLSECEKEKGKDLEKVSSCFGNILKEIFSYKEDIFTEDLKEMGFYLGKYIYLLDAYVDMEKDKKKNNYNILNNIHSSFSSDEELKNYVEFNLKRYIKNVARVFERLPILKNAEMIRNIIYAGVWSVFDQKGAKKDGSIHSLRNFTHGK